MSKKVKLIGIFLVMAVLLSLIAIVPSMAATAGTVTLEGGAVNQTIRWLSATDDLVASQPIVNTNQIITVKVSDPDKNVLTELPGTCSDNAGAIQNFKCELLANPGPGPNAAFTTGHGSLEDANQDDIPDNLLVRGLQQNASGWITAGTSAATGAVQLTAGLLAGAYQTLEPVGTVGASTGPNVPPTALSNYAQVQAVISAIVGAPTLGAGGLSVTGTSIDPLTMQTTAGVTEILVPAGAVAAGTYVSTNFWVAIDSWSADVSSGAGNTFDYTLEENYTVAARYKYNSVDSITGLVSVASSAHALAVDIDLREAQVDAAGNVIRDANFNLQDSAGSGVFAADLVITKNTLDHGKTGGRIYEDTKALGGALIRGQRLATGTHTGGADAAMLTDAAAGFVAAGVVIGDVVFNTTDGSSGVITAVTATTITATLSGGTENDWDNGDTYNIGDGRYRVFGDNGSLITVSYKDEDPVATVTSTARVDLTPPVIELISPADDSYSNVQGQTFVVKVTDTAIAENAAAGLDATEINNITVDNVLSADLTPLLVGTNSLQVSYSLTITAEGPHQWWIAVRDQVGNVPDYTTADAVAGAGDPAEIASAGGAAGAGAPANPFTLTIDTAAPTYASAETGGRLATADDVTAGPPAVAEDDWLADTTERKSVTVTYALGAGDAPIDATTVANTDFRIAGITPASVSVANAAGAAGAKTQSIVVSTAADQATDATPLVEIVGTFTDKAGNAVSLITGTDASDATDKLAPVLDVDIVGDVSSIPASNTEVTINVTSTESANLTGTVAFLKVAADTTLEEDTAKRKTISFSSTGTNQWQSTVAIDAATGTAVADTPGALNVQVTATDDLSNVGTAGKADPDGTAAAGGTAGTWVDGALVFEFDNELNDSTAPTFQLSPNLGGAQVTTTDIDSPFVRIDFDVEGNEYPVGAVDVDTHATITLSSATLLEPGAAAAEDVLALVKQIDDNSFVLATSGLALGDYTLTVTAQDEVGNVSTTAGATDAEEFTFAFTVTEKALFELDLIPGMNLVSIPMDPVSTAIDDVLGSVTQVDLVVSYDPAAANGDGPWLIAERNAETGLFEGTLTSIDSMHGYWVRASSYATVEIDLPRQGYQQLIPTIPVVAGWNLVPIINLGQAAQGTAVDEDSYFANLVTAAGGPAWNVAWTFDTMNNAWNRIQIWQAGANLAVGSAYWVWAIEAGTIVP